MGRTRHLPETPQRRLERLERDNWRTQVSTAPVLGAPPGDVDESGIEAIEYLLGRVDDLEQRMTNMEGGGSSG